MVTPFDSSITSSVLSPWLDTNATVDGVIGAYSFYTEPVGDGYNKIALTALAPQASAGGYFRVNTASIPTPGYTYIGLTQSLTSSTDSVDQGVSRIDIGIKIEPGIVYLVIGGAESIVIGDNSSIYTVIFDGLSGFVVFNNNDAVYSISLSELSNLGVDIKLTNPLNLGFVSYSPELDIPFDAGSVTNLNLKIGEGGVFDPISSQSSFSVITPSGQTSITIPLATGEEAAYSYELIQLSNPPQVLQTYTSSNYTVSENPRRVTLSFTNSLMTGVDIQIVKVSQSEIRSKSFTITNKTVTATNVSTYGVDTGQGFYNAALNLSHPEFSSNNGIAVIASTLLSQISGKPKLTVGVDPISILPVIGSLAKIPVPPTELVSVICGTVDPNDSNVLNVNQNIQPFSVYGGSLDILQLAAFTAVEVPPFQTGSSPTLTLSWAGGISKTKVAIFTDQKSQDYYFNNSISSLPGYYTTADVTNDTIQLSSPANGAYYFYPLTVSDDTTMAHFGTESSITITGTSWPPGSPPHIPVVDSVNLAITPGYTKIYWSQQAGDKTYADATKFDITIKTLAGEVVDRVQGVITPPHSFSNLAEGTYNVIVTAYSSEDITAESLPFEYQQPGVGGGGGGGGGNTGSTGHNNMAALEYRYPDWSVDVNQAQTITVLGEESDALTVDETVVINVPLAQFKQCLAYKSTWDASLTGTEAGSQPLPEVALRVAADSAAALTEINTIFAALKGTPSGALSSRTMLDDASTSHDCFSKRLADGSITFANSVFDSQDLPKVAIRSISEGEITAEDLSTTLAKVTTANAPHKAYLEGLFEQAVAEGRVKKDDGPSDEGSGWKAPSFVAGDSLSVMVKYNFKQSRIYEVDGLDVDGNSAAKAVTLTIGSSTFTIQVGDDGREESEDVAGNSRMYEFKLVATA